MDVGNGLPHAGRRTRHEERFDAVIRTRPPPGTTPDDLHANVQDAINLADVEAFLGAHVPEATVVVPPDGRTVHGREQIRSAIAPLLGLRP